MMNFPMTNNTKLIMDEGVSFAKRYGFKAVGTEALLYGMTCAPSSVACRVLAKYGITRDTLVTAISKVSIDHRTNEFSYARDTVKTIKTVLEFFPQAMSEGVTSEELLYVMCRDSSCMAYRILNLVLRVNPSRILSDLTALVSPSGQSIKPQGISKMFESLLTDMAREMGANVDKNAFSLDEAITSDDFENKRRTTKTAQKKNSMDSDDGLSSTLPSHLLEMGIDLTSKAKSGKIDPIIGRDAETERVIEILCRKTKNNPVLIGEAGVGKSAVVEGLALRIANGNVPHEMRNKIIYSLDIGSMMAGTKYRGSMEEKLKNLIETIVEEKNIIVFIDEIHMLAQAGSKDGEISPSDMLKPYLARGEFQTVGATTNDEYRKFIEKDKALERRFQPVKVDEPNEEDCKKILKGIRPTFEKFHSVKISDDAIDAAVTLSTRYIMDRYLPDKAIDLVDEAASKLKVKYSGNPSIEKLERELDGVLQKQRKASEEERYIDADSFKKQADDIRAEIVAMSEENDSSKTLDDKVTVTAEDIAAVVSKWTKIPVSKLTESEKEKLMNLESILHKRVIGQDEAVKSVASAIRRARAGLKSANRPIGSFIFLGPTGVGKTELTKALAECLFDDENMVIRLDMSEYMESHSVSKLIGSPPGYVGHDDGGQLTEAVRRNPYSVVLFDEIEKAHPDVFNILLQMLDDGRLTDSLGRTVSFKNTIIILTSNIGVSTLPKKKANIGFGGEQENNNNSEKEHLLKALKSAFKPELLNRIDQTIVFSRLTRDDISKIAGIMIKSIEKKLAEKSISLKFTKGAMNEIFEKGYDPEYGARPLRRFLEQHIEDGLAENILSGKINNGDTVVVSFKNGKFDFTPKKDETDKN